MVFHMTDSIGRDDTDSGQMSREGGECPGGTCAYSEAGLFSTAVTDPFLGG